MVTAHTTEGVCHIIDNGRADNFDQLQNLFVRYNADIAGVDCAYNTSFVLSNLLRLGTKWLAIRGVQTMQGQFDIQQVNAVDGMKDKAQSGTVKRFDVNNTHFKRILVKMRNMTLAGLATYKNTDVLLYRHLLAS